MKKKERGPLRSQVLGIVWMSIGLLFFGTVSFFYGRTSKKMPIEVSATTSDSVFKASNQSEERGSYAHAKPTLQPRHTAAPSRATAETLQNPTPSAPHKRQTLRIELNSADTLTLQLLHGIGPAFARRIVNYRERLGGFYSIDQLNEVYGLTPDLVGHIRPYLSLDTSLIRPLDINSIGLKELIRHPYIEYFQARDIVQLRNSGLHFDSPADLLAVPSMTDSTLALLLPYLHF